MVVEWVEPKVSLVVVQLAALKVVWWAEPLAEKMVAWRVENWAD